MTTIPQGRAPRAAGALAPRFRGCLRSIRRDARYLGLAVRRVVLDYVTGRRERRRRFLEHLLLFDYLERGPGRVKSVDLDDLLPRSATLPVTRPPRSREHGEVSDVELDALCRIACYLRPRHVFEIGTFTGSTTLHLALNTPDDCRIETLDLPAVDIGKVKYSVEGQEAHIQKEMVGARFLDHPLRSRITIHLADSATFDYTPFRRKMDLVFVDGSHTYDYVSSDTRNAFAMLAPGGVVVWHDFLSVHHEDVTRFLFELAERVPVYHLLGTNIALAAGPGESISAAGRRGALQGI